MNRLILMQPLEGGGHLGLQHGWHVPSKEQEPWPLAWAGDHPALSKPGQRLLLLFPGTTCVKCAGPVGGGAFIISVSVTIYLVKPLLSQNCRYASHRGLKITNIFILIPIVYCLCTYFSLLLCIVLHFSLSTY